MSKSLSNLLDVDIKKYQKKSDMKSLVALLFDFGLIIISISSVVYYSKLYGINTYYYILFFINAIIVGSRLHGFAALAHDAIHYSLFKNKKLNNILGNILFWLIFYSFEGKRNLHFTHHAFVNHHSNDPKYLISSKVDQAIDNSPIRLILFFLFLMTGLLGIYMFLKGIANTYGLTSANKKVKKSKDNLPEKNKYYKLLFYLVIFSFISYFSIWFEFFIYYIFPLFSFFMTSTWVRVLSEHSHIPNSKNRDNDNFFGHTRTVTANWLEGFLFAPHNAHYHVEHHLFPTVPFYNLSKLHKKLMENKYFSENVCVNKSYFEVMKEQILYPRNFVSKAHNIKGLNITLDYK